MQKFTRSVRTNLFKVKGWSRGLAPFVAQTLTLQRPLRNRNIARATQCAAIDEYFSLTINNSQQWLRIRGQRLDNPVLLYLHGGPGGSQIPSYRHYQLLWERHFTVVHWEQRGSGKSYSRNLDPATLTLPQLVSDGLAVVDYLAKRFARRDIVLLGHSWGSMLGIHMLQTNPQAVAAYIGVGQVSNQIESERLMYNFVLDAANAAQDDASSRLLTKLKGYPIGRSAAGVATVRSLARKYGYLDSRAEDTARTYARLMDTPEYGLLDIYRFLKGTLVSSATLGKTLMSDAQAQPTALPLTFAHPVYFISGRRDHFTPAAPADAYLNRLQAPSKRHIVFDESGHYPNEDEPERFLALLLSLLEPHVKPADTQR